MPSNGNRRPRQLSCVTCDTIARWQSYVKSHVILVYTKSLTWPSKHTGKCQRAHIQLYIMCPKTRSVFRARLSYSNAEPGSCALTLILYAESLHSLLDVKRLYAAKPKWKGPWKHE